MPNPREFTFKQMTLDFASKQGTMPPSSNGKAKSSPSNTASSRFSPYYPPPGANSKNQVVPSPAVKRRATGMGFKRSESGSKMVIDLTEEEDGAVDMGTPENDLPSRSTFATNVYDQIESSLNVGSFKYDPTRSSIPYMRSSSRTEHSTLSSSSTFMSTTTEKLSTPKTTMGRLAGEFSLPSASKVKHRKIGQSFSASSAKSTGKWSTTKSLRSSDIRRFSEIQEDGPPDTKAIKLSEEQEMVARLVIEGKESLFFTGSAGKPATSIHTSIQSHSSHYILFALSL